MIEYVKRVGSTTEKMKFRKSKQSVANTVKVKLTCYYETTFFGVHLSGRKTTLIHKLVCHNSPKLPNVLRFFDV